MLPPTRDHDDDRLRGSISGAESISTLLENLDAARARAGARPRGRPFVTLAYAQSLDGSIATARGHRTALSGPEALALTHTLRARHDAILVGVGTVLADDPELRVRLVDGPSPRPVIVDSHLSTPTSAKLLAQAGRSVWIAATNHVEGPQARARHARAARLHAQAGACRVIECPALPNGWVDLGALMRRLDDERVRHVMVEGGARIITSFLEARLLDYAVITVAPLFLGGLAAVGPWTGVAAAPGAQAPARLEGWTSCQVGRDLVLGGEIVWTDG